MWTNPRHLEHLDPPLSFDPGTTLPGTRAAERPSPGSAWPGHAATSSPRAAPQDLSDLPELNSTGETRDGAAPTGEPRVDTGRLRGLAIAS